MKTQLAVASDFARTRFVGVLALVSGLACFGTSCVSQVQYEEVLAEVKYYQRAYQDLESFQGTLEADNKRLTGELGLRPGEPIEAAATRDIDARLAELDRVMSRLGGAPGNVTVLSVEGGYGLRLADALLFDSGSATLKPAGRELLLEMAKEIRQGQFVRVWVRGHTDSDPVKRSATLQKFPRGNIELSAARAIEVAALLGGEGGISPNKLVVAGFGAAEPVAANDTPAAKSLNRRVEIFVIEDAGK